MNGNDFMAWMLRSPFHGILSGGMMLITVAGRKTGRQYTTPVEYYKEGGYLWVITSRNRTWWRNLRGGANVRVLMRRQPAMAFAEPILDQRAVEARLCDFAKHKPMTARQLGIRIENGQPSAEDIARVAAERLFVKFKIGSE